MINSVQPNFTGRRLSKSEINYLIKTNRTLPLGVSSIKPKSNLNTKVSGLTERIKDFFKNLFN